MIKLFIFAGISWAGRNQWIHSIPLHSFINYAYSPQLLYPCTVIIFRKSIKLLFKSFNWFAVSLLLNSLQPFQLNLNPINFLNWLNVFSHFIQLMPGFKIGWNWAAIELIYSAINQINLIDHSFCLNRSPLHFQ